MKNCTSVQAFFCSCTEGQVSAPKGLREQKVAQWFQSEVMRPLDGLVAVGNFGFLAAESSLERVPSATMEAFEGRLAQRLERPAYTGKVRGSNP